MKKHLLGLCIAVAFLGWSTFAAWSVRPSLENVLGRRPSLSDIRRAAKPIPSQPISITWQVYTGLVASWSQQPSLQPRSPQWTVYSTPTGSWREDPVLGRQNAADVKAFREEKGYIIRYLKKTTGTEKRSQLEAVESVVKTLLATQKNMVKTYEAAAKTTTLMTQEAWDSQAEAAVIAYRGSLLSYIDPTKMTGFERFIVGRTNLLKEMFEKLESMRKATTQ